MRGFLFREQGFHFLPYFLIAPAALVRKLGAHGRIACHRAIEDRFYLLPRSAVILFRCGDLREKPSSEGRCPSWTKALALGV